jgi:uncharacterized protein (TIGR03083 family)
MTEMTDSQRAMPAAGQAPGRPRQSALPRAVADRLAAAEYERVLALLRDLAGPEWELPTCCPGWDVKAMAGHMLGMAEFAGSLRENLRQARAAGRAGGVWIDALTALQVAEHAHLTPAELADRFAVAAPRAARGRRRVPGVMRRRALAAEQPVGDRTEPWTYGYVVETIATRDNWMHRLDICAATGRTPVLTADHDGVLVADVAREWAGRHGQPCALTLSGPAGGSFSFGAGGPRIDLDAVEFCRILAGRAAGDGLLTVQVPF